jgi:hypothetical protein
MATVFFSYAHADEALRDQLEQQLSMLRRQGVIETWQDRRIGAGADFAQEIDEHVNSDDIILLLVSSDFLDSDYCYEREMRRALERHEAGESIVIPVILRPCEWQQSPFGKLNATPPDGRPITKFADRDDGFLEVTKAVRSAAEKINARTSDAKPKPAAARVGQESLTGAPRSSNLSLAKKFTQQDHDRFQLETFEYISRYFENSLSELGARNAGIDTTYRQIDANRFSAIIYRDGEPIARATIFLGTDQSFANGLAYSANDSGGSNSFNELLTVQSDDESIFFKPMGMNHLMRYEDRDKKLTMEGAAELYWSMLIAPLQPRR